ncbi:hypothetical protein ACKGJN_07030 [Gillisia sp. Q332]|uniref:hypothetical protein n=1 Tax=Gillisia xinjiangensis TaxID=3384765 RepID=UPI00391A38FA
MNINSFKKRIKKDIKKLLYHNFNWYKGKFLGIHLQGGLCNKLHCLFSACDIAINEKSRIIEPYFGWEKPILFSEIYDLDYFNSKMSEFNNGKNLIISRDKLNTKSAKLNSIENVVDLWKYSERELFKQRNTFSININSTKLRVLNALKLRPEYQSIVDSYTNDKSFTAIQIRTESDWVRHAGTNKVNGNEKILVSLDEILKMVADFEIVGDLFFTSGQNHSKISENIKKLDIQPHHFYQPNYEYEINAAINFEICCRSHYFIGLSRSSYSNLISLKRAGLLNNDNSFIYNYRDKILKRQDMGIQYVAELSVNNKTVIK